MKWLMSVVGGAAITVLAASTSARTPVFQAPQTASRPATLDDGWQTATLEEAAIDRRQFEALTQSIRSRPELNIHAVLIEHDGRLVYEEYFSGRDERLGEPLGVVTFNRNTLHDIRSMTKSVVSALFGIAHTSGAIPSLDAPLLDYFPEYKDLQVPERRKITIKHALTMSAGLGWNEEVPYNDPRNDEIAMDRSPDPFRFALGKPIVTAPGTEWNYSGGSTQILGEILQRATKRPMVDFAREKVFVPLGITRFEWLGRHGPAPASGLRMRLRDAAKFGSLYLHEGRWKDRQVVPAEWVRESTRRHIGFPGMPDRGYGFQWWHRCYQTPTGGLEIPFAVGNGTQRIFLLRAHRTVMTVFAGRYNDFSQDPARDLMLQFVVPALPKVNTPACPS